MHKWGSSALFLGHRDRPLGSDCIILVKASAQHHALSFLSLISPWFLLVSLCLSLPGLSGLFGHSGLLWCPLSLSLSLCLVSSQSLPGLPWYLPGLPALSDLYNSLISREKMNPDFPPWLCLCWWLTGGGGVCGSL